MTTDRPKPGSDEARQQGCVCPVLDNNHGKSRMKICTHCHQVEGVDSFVGRCSMLDSRDHDWVDAVVTECPYLTRTPTGRVSRKRIKAADTECFAAGEEVHGSHHYGDHERHHFDLPV